MDPQSGYVVLVVVELGMGSQQTLKHLRVECGEEKDKTCILTTHHTDFPSTVTSCSTEFLAVLNVFV